MIRVKHRGKISKPRAQPGSGAQGASLGNQEFLSQTNHNADSVPIEDRFKYVDDLTTLEIINLLSIGLSSYNYKLHVPSDIPTDGYFVDNSNLKTQHYLEEINKWTNNQKMVINTKKTKAMIINFTHKYQFGTRMKLEDTNIELVDEMKILGTVISSDLSWNTNTKHIIQKVNKRMIFLKKIQSFGATPEEMVHLWTLYCRSILEQSSVVWSSSLSSENRTDIERTQKSFAKMILRNNYTTYEEALLKLNLQTLEERRKILSLKFAKKCLSNDKFKDLFPRNETTGVETRQKEKYKVPFCHTERMRQSALITMKHQLNAEY